MNGEKRALLDFIYIYYYYYYMGQFNSPTGVCLGPAPVGGGYQLLYVADKNNHRVQVLNAITGAIYRHGRIWKCRGAV